MSYTIITDTGCDIAPELLKEWKVSCADLTFHNAATQQTYINSDITSKEFYQQMRDGASFKTAAANTEDFKKVFIPVLEEGLDILYIAFSSGLSSTVNAGRLAALELQETYKDRKIVVIDSLCASSGQGLMVYLAVQKQNNGATLEETEAYINEIVPQLCHWFTVDDLEYLKRGGRVSSATALVGNMLGIKPVLHVDDEGHLIKVTTARGRKLSIKALAEQYMELSNGSADGIYFISHGDCLEDAKLLEEKIYEKTQKKATIISDIGPVIGSHSGPGTLALFFLGKNR